MIILASASPRRAELLARAGISFNVKVSPAEEPERKPRSIPTDLWPTCLAYMKAVAVQKQICDSPARIANLKSQRSNRPPLILAADTIVVHGQRIVNKARNRAHARRILLSLSGQTHEVITGICLLRGPHVRLSCAVATCKFKKLSERQLTAYLDSGLWQGKAGAYGIQDAHDDPFVRLLTGDITTVMGLPLALVQSELACFPKD